MEAKEFLTERQNKSTKSLFKGFLVLLEDLYTEHQIHFKKLKENIPSHEDVISQADYFEDNLENLGPNLRALLLKRLNEFKSLN